MGEYIISIEIGRKQKYIFSSNHLAENVGASIIIRKATEEDAKEYYEKYNPKVIYEGGGNALYVFVSKQDGIEFSKEYSESVLKSYPGIVLYLVGYELEKNMTVKEGIQHCRILMTEKKNRQAYIAGIIDYGKTLHCSVTNLPATNHGSLCLPEEWKEKPLSKESLIKYKHSRERNRVFEKLEIKGYQFPIKEDDLGRKREEKSYTAVVHIDGNRMGEAFQKFDEKIVQKGNQDIEIFNQKYIRALGNFSKEIKDKYKEAFKEMVQVLVNNMDKLKSELDLEEGNLPICPLIIAGDDICFICDGRIGIELARIYLEKIKEKKLNACAGVAIVKSHYPFSKAYKLAEQLCQNAKDFIKEGEKASYLDWHIEEGELGDSISEIRKENYRAEDGALLYLKPYKIGEKKSIGEEKSENAFANFFDALEIIREKNDNEEIIPRSKIKEFRDISRKGEKETQYFLTSNQLEEKLERTNHLKGIGSFTEREGKKHNLFFDVIEVMDLYIKLEE